MKRRAPTGSVAMGFSVNTCLPALIAASKCMRPVAGRRAQHHDIDIGGEQLLVGIESDEMMVRLHADARLDGRNQILRLHLPAGRRARRDAGMRKLGIAQLCERLFQMVFEDVRHGDQLDVLVAGEQVHHGLRAASATANQSGLQPVARSGPRSARLKEREGGGPGEQAPAGDTVQILHHSTVSHSGRRLRCVKQARNPAGLREDLEQDRTDAEVTLALRAAAWPWMSRVLDQVFQLFAHDVGLVG